MASQAYSPYLLGDKIVQAKNQFTCPDYIHHQKAFFESDEMKLKWMLKNK